MVTGTYLMRLVPIGTDYLIKDWLPWLLVSDKRLVTMVTGIWWDLPWLSIYLIRVVSMVTGILQYTGYQFTLLRMVYDIKLFFDWLPLFM